MTEEIRTDVQNISEPDKRSRLIEGARNGTKFFVRAALARGDHEVPACLVGRCIGVAERTAAFESGERVIVVTLASIREITSVPDVLGDEQ